MHRYRIKLFSGKYGIVFYGKMVGARAGAVDSARTREQNINFTNFSRFLKVLRSIGGKSSRLVVVSLEMTLENME